MWIREYRRVMIMGLVVLFILAGVMWGYLHQLDQVISGITKYTQSLKGQFSFIWKNKIGVPVTVLADTFEEAKKFSIVYLGGTIFLCSLGVILFWKVTKRILKCHEIIDNGIGGNRKKWGKQLDKYMEIIMSKLSKDISEVKRVYDEVGDIKDNMDREVEKIISDLKRTLEKTSHMFQFAFSGKKKVEGLQKDLEYLKEKMNFLKESMSEVSKTEMELKGILDDFQNVGDNLSGKLIKSRDICNELLEVVKSTIDQNEYISKLVENITEISTQVNLLTVNTAIEATRIGKDGKGVAKIAEEMREINHHISEMEEEMLSIVKKIHNQVSTVGMLIEKCLKQLEKGIQFVYSFQHGIHSTREKVKNVGERIIEVYSFLNQQDNTSTQISKDINEFLLEWEEAERMLSDMRTLFASLNTSIRKVNGDIETVITSITRLKDKISRDDFSGECV